MSRLKAPGLLIVVLVCLAAGTIVLEARPTRHVDTLDTISVDVALDYFQACKLKRGGLFRSREHSFGAWELECKWREE